MSDGSGMTNKAVNFIFIFGVCTMFMCDLINYLSMLDELFV
jgi:hypothetical protein